MLSRIRDTKVFEEIVKNLDYTYMRVYALRVVSIV